MVFYTVFCRYDRFMEGEYSKEQKEINYNSNETYDFVVESLFGQHNQSGSGFAKYGMLGVGGTCVGPTYFPD